MYYLTKKNILKVALYVGQTPIFEQTNKQTKTEKK